MRLISDLYHTWLVKAARRDMRSAAFYVGRAEDRLKAAGLELPPREVAVPLVGSRHAIRS
ncbi:hypothetical protein [Methylobacterium sp. 37f]|uniref:hypothetical protein n=1 Tax=Methylobacterium sp. 37f TaxID=2817058 RepID=UPI001FFDE7F8|nr:hypothetical protein [Methylobacterium sp. 37f]MCK2057241.1 hypothetical protein [Methylobacterium sp. 37f]